jgi:hypothetical protein
MWPSLLSFGLLAAFASSVHATALTYKLAPNEKACFFADVQPNQLNAKIAFYFAVRASLLSLQTLDTSKLKTPPSSPPENL